MFLKQDIVKHKMKGKQLKSVGFFFLDVHDFEII